jgi:hypothetical protein
MQTVPFTPEEYDQQLIVKLGDDTYVFDARWNERGKIWTFDLSRDSDQVQLLAGVPLLAGQDVLSPYALGIGALLVTDLSQKNTDPGPDDLGDRVLVSWLSNDELAELKAALKGTRSGQTIVVGGAPSSGGSSGGGSSGGSSSGGGQTTINQTTNQTINNFTILGAGGFSSPELKGSDSGNQELVYRFPQNPALNPNPSIALVSQFFAEGAGTVRFYVGGATIENFDFVGTPSGDLIASVSVSGATAIYWIQQALPNPNTRVPVKVTIQASTPGTYVKVYGIEGTLG